MQVLNLAKFTEQFREVFFTGFFVHVGDNDYPAFDRSDRCRGSMGLSVGGEGLVVVGGREGLGSVNLHRCGCHFALREILAESARWRAEFDDSSDSRTRLYSLLQQRGCQVSRVLRSGRFSCWRETNGSGRMEAELLISKADFDAVHGREFIDLFHHAMEVLFFTEHNLPNAIWYSM